VKDLLMTKNEVVIGDLARELRQLQLLALALSQAAERLSRLPVQKACAMAVGPLLLAAAKALSLGSCAGLNTPLEVLALSARNSFELWLRLIYVVTSDANYQSWRDEALTDQLRVYEAILTLDSSDERKAVIRSEIDHVKQHGTAVGLTQGQKIMMTGDLAKVTGHKAEYDAFYKLYSKLVHPSSWSVNWPGAVSSEMYRAAMSANAQRHAWRILEIVDKEFNISAEECYQAAIAQFESISTTAVQ
jgi:hypothetical protein